MTHDEEIKWLTENGFSRTSYFQFNEVFERKFGAVEIAFIKGLTEARLYFKDQVALTVWRPAVGDIKDFLFEVLTNAEELMFGCQEMSDELNAKYWPHRIEKE